MSSLKRFRGVTVLVAPLSLVGCGGGEPEANDEAGSRQRVARVEVERIEPRPAVELVQVSADLQASRRALLAAEVSGVIESVAVELGDRVSAGQVLVRIDTRTIATEVAEAEAVLRQAEEDAERAEALFEKRSITRDRLTAARTELEVARARAQSMRLRLDKSQIRAPWNGEVAARMVEVGGFIDVGEGVVELVAVERMKVRAEVPAEDAPFLSVGDVGTLTLQALPGTSFEAKVARLGAALDAASRTLPIEVELDNAEGRLKPGMFGRLTLPRRRLEAALTVPLAALVDYEAGQVLYVVEDGVAHRRPVALGAVLGERIVVEEGIEPGAAVIVRGQDQVADGQPVELS